MGFLDAAEEVLKRAGEPLHYREITGRAIAQGLVETKGQTPARTMNAQLSTSIQSGESPFVRVGRGVYGLAEWEQGAEKVSVPSPTSEPRREYRSYKDAAQRVLIEVGRPVHYNTRRSRSVPWMPNLSTPRG